MNTLFLNLASQNGLLACVTEQRVIASIALDHRVDDGELITMLEKLLQEARWKFTDLTHVACVTGPGGFMSLRVAVSLANTLVHQLKIPGTGVHLSDLYAARKRDSDLGPRTSGNFLWLHSTKKHELFVRGFGEYAKLWPEAIHMQLDEFLLQAPASAQWIGELLPEHEAAMTDKRMKPDSLQPIAEVLPFFLEGLTYGPETLEPWYGREG